MNHQKNPDKIGLFLMIQNGEGEIRTPATLSSRPVFETGAFSRSATSPRYIITPCKTVVSLGFSGCSARCYSIRFHFARLHRTTRKFAA